MEELIVPIGGRTLDVIVSGPPDGRPFVFHHGTPSCKVQFEPFVEAASERGLRTVTYSRPGYGGSGRHDGRSVGDAAADTGAILDAIGAESAITAGASGGGPHALACAALLPDRIGACATIAGCAPHGVEGLDFMAGMGEANIVEFGMALRREDDELVDFMEKYVEETSNATPEDIVESLRSLLPPVDEKALQGELGLFFVQSDKEAFRTGIWGWFDDDLAFTEPWGFELDTIDVPVRVWQGAQDLMVPIAHGEWLASNVAGAKAELSPDEGHLSIAVGRFGDILDALVADAGWS